MAAARIVAAGAGLAALGATLLLPPPEGLSPAGWRAAGLALLLAAFWIGEVLPNAVTALLPAILLPPLGIASLEAATAPYADPVIFLFLGGFALGAAMQRTGLHRRIGLLIVARAGTSPRRLVAGFLGGAGFLSMWVSNSAAAIMLLPVALSVAALHARAGGREDANLAVSLLLSVAFGASIGGMATLIGTPPNALLVAFLAREHGIRIGFAEWMLLGVPLALLLLVAAWIILTRLHPVPPGADLAPAIAAERAAQGRMSAAERRVLALFAAVAAAWLLRPVLLPALSDPAIALTGMVALFVLPDGSGRALLRWEEMKDTPWGVLILFGGGLSLAAAITGSGLAAWLGGRLAGLGGLPLPLLVFAAVLAMGAVTSVTSNTAAAATFLPLGAAVAVGIGQPALTLALPLALSASAAFLLPVATPPNAVVFASGQVTAGQMARAGALLHLAAAVAITGFAWPAGLWLFGGRGWP